MMEKKVIDCPPESGSFCNSLHVHKIREVREQGIMHFAHPKHPLMFMEEFKKEVGKEDIMCCNGCGLEIGRSGFSCSMENCSFLLHEFCAFLPKEMRDYPNHPQHPLILYTHLASDRSSHFDCYVCDTKCSLFSYHCEDCHFNVGVKCASISVLVCGGYIHKHNLMAQLYPASFLCCYCGEKHGELGMSYQCRTCSFWIHEQCYSLPSTVKHDSHMHPLKLWSGFAKNICGVCEENISPGSWFYGCNSCTYKIHVKCSTKKWDKKIETPVYQDQSFQFPMSSAQLVQDTLVQFIKNTCQWIDAEDKDGDILDHPSHDHPLTLEIDSSKFIRSVDSDDIAKRGAYFVCNACTLPLLDAPIYSCNQSCKFVLHKWCAKLPRELEHPAHPNTDTDAGHTLILKEKLDECFGFFRCKGCGAIGNGFAYKCKKCEDYYLDIRCATLPSSINYEIRDHPLHHPLLLKHRSTSGGCISCGNSNIHECNDPICNYNFSTITPSSNPFLYGCDACHFYVDIKCLILPQEVQHWYDEHGFKLTESTDVPTQGENENLCYHCEFCEQQIVLNNWIYYCSECKQCLGTECVRKFFGLFPSLIKFGGSYNSPHHLHPLTSIAISEENFCHRCHEDCFKFGIGFQCRECEIVYGLECAYSKV